MTKNDFKQLPLDSSLLQAIHDCGYFSYTSIQKKALPLLLEGGDFLIQAATGTGKTATFCIPLIQSLSFEQSECSVLILTPTRELAHQVKEEFNRLGLYKKINCVCCVGREDFKKQAQQLKQKSPVLVGTPGRIFDHYLHGNLDLKKIKTLVLDEATELISNGLLEQVQLISQEIESYQTWLFSATLECESAFDFLSLHSPTRIEEGQSHQVYHQVHTYFYETPNLQEALNQIFTHEKITSCFLFTNTQEEASSWFNKLRKQGLSCSLLHGGIPQKKRREAIQKFKQGKSRLLISTNVAARGLDIKNASHVLHLQCPTDYDSYIHRAGRTGRHHDEGISIVLSDSFDSSSIKEQIKNETPIYQLPATVIDNQLHQPRLILDDNQVFKEKNSTLFIRAGKKDKVRSMDIVGALCSLEGITQENLGIIDIQATFSTVTLLNLSSQHLPSFDQFTIKGKRRKVEIKKTY